MKKNYHIQLSQNANDIAKSLCQFAAQSNSSNYTSLKELEVWAILETKRWPTLYDNVTIHLIGDTLLVDRGIENLLVIEEREYHELVRGDEEPTDKLGIANEQNHELIN